MFSTHTSFLKIKFEYLVLSFLLITGLFLRFYHLSQQAYFQLDEEKDSFLVRRVVVEHKPILVAAGIPGGINMGPAFIYISSIIMALSHMHPIGEAAFASFMGVVTIGLLFWVAKTLFNTKTAILASIFYALSYLVIIYNRIYWPLVFNPTLTLLAYYILYQIISHKRYKLTIVLGLLAVLMTQTEASNLATLLLIIFVWIGYRLPIKRQEVILGLLIVIVGQLPLLLFDLRHNFLNFKRIIQFFHPTSGTTNAHLSIIPFEQLIHTFVRLFSITGPNDLIKQILPCPYLIDLRSHVHPALMVLGGLVLLLFIYFSLRKKSIGLRIILTHLFILLAGIIFYNLFFPGYVHEWFYYGFFPALFLIVSYCLTKFWSINVLKPLLLFSVGVFIWHNLDLAIHAKNSFGLDSKLNAVRFALSRLDNQPFYLNSIGSCYSYGGYRYLFWLEGRAPSTSYMDSIYGDWVYPLYRGYPPRQGVVFVHDAPIQEVGFSKQYQDLVRRAVDRERFGALEVFISK